MNTSLGLVVVWDIPNPNPQEAPSIQMGPEEGGATAARAHPLTAISLLLSASCNRSVISLEVYSFLQNKMYALHGRS